jgi:hypothetical protein
VSASQADQSGLGRRSIEINLLGAAFVQDLLPFFLAEPGARPPT